MVFRVRFAWAGSGVCVWTSAGVMEEWPELSESRSLWCCHILTDVTVCISQGTFGYLASSSLCPSWLTFLLAGWLRVEFETTFLITKTILPILGEHFLRRG